MYYRLLSLFAISAKFCIVISSALAVGLIPAPSRTEMISGFGIGPFPNCMSMEDFQFYVVSDQLHKEELALKAAEAVQEEKVLIVYDRAVFDDKAYVYGTPWNGKHNIGENTCAPVRAIVFLSQAPENHAAPINPVEAITLLLQQTVLPSDKAHLSKLLDMLGRMVETIPMIRLGCTISDEAVTTVYREIYDDQQ